METLSFDLLQFLYHLALAILIGGSLVLGTAVAPVLFTSSRSRSDAGTLFGNTRNANSRSELIVLITPHVMRTKEDADASTEELKSKLHEVQKLIN